VGNFKRKLRGAPIGAPLFGLLYTSHADSRFLSLVKRDKLLDILPHLHWIKELFFAYLTKLTGNLENYSLQYIDIVNGGAYLFWLNIIQYKRVC
jgi:hypothetical protein